MINTANRKISIMLLSLPALLWAQLEWSGFGDIQLLVPGGEWDQGQFTYGQFEVDLSAEISPTVTFEGAIALNPEDGGFEAGAGFIDFHREEGAGDHPARGGILDHAGLMLGQFDIPFGIDWEHIASADRRLVSGPLMSEMILADWNDIGLNGYSEFNQFEVNAFIANGGEIGYAVGARLGFHVGELAELGSSFLAQTAANSAGTTPKVLGFDLQSQVSLFSLRGEFQKSTAVCQGDFDTVSEDYSAYYAQVDLELEDILSYPIFLIGRYGAWEASESVDTDGSGSIDAANRITAGCGLALNESLEMRFEYRTDQWESNDRESQIIFQTLISF